MSQRRPRRRQGTGPYAHKRLIAGMAPTHKDWNYYHSSFFHPLQFTIHSGFSIIPRPFLVLSSTAVYYLTPVSLESASVSLLG